MANIDSFYPTRLKGWALGLNAGGGNLGVAVVQLVGAGGPRHRRQGPPADRRARLRAAGDRVDRVRMALHGQPHGGERTTSGRCATCSASRTPGSCASSTSGRSARSSASASPSGRCCRCSSRDTFDTPIKAAYLTFLGPLLGSLVRPVGGRLADRARRRPGHDLLDVPRDGCSAPRVVIIASVSESLGALPRRLHRAVRAERARQRLDLQDDPGGLRRARRAPADRRRRRRRRCDAARRGGCRRALIGIAGSIGALRRCRGQPGAAPVVPLGGHRHGGVRRLRRLLRRCASLLTWSVYLRSAQPVGGGGMTAADVQHADVLVVGNGMVGHRFVEAAPVVATPTPRPAGGRARRGAAAGPTTGCTCRRCSTAPTPTTLTLGAPTAVRHRRASSSCSATRWSSLDTAAAHGGARRPGVRGPTGSCVLATGFVAVRAADPRHRRRRACSSTARIDDLDAIRELGRRRAARGVVVGGGLLGLEAANALRLLGLDVTVVEFAPRLMAVQLDDGGGRALRRHVEALGLARAHRRRGAQAIRRSTTAGVVRAARVRRGRRRSPPTSSCSPPASGRATSSPATPAWTVGERGGVVVDDACATSAPGVYADRRGRLPRRSRLRPRRAGLRAWPRSSPTASPAAIATFTGADLSHDAQAARRRRRQRRRPARRAATTSWSPIPPTGTWQKVVLGAERQVLGAVLVGDVAAVRRRWCSALRGRCAGADVLDLLRPVAAAGDGRPTCADDAGVCSCHNVVVRRGARRRRARASRTSPASSRARRPAPAAGRACRCCRS